MDIFKIGMGIGAVIFTGSAIGEFVNGRSNPSVDFTPLEMPSQDPVGKNDDNEADVDI